MEKANLGGSLLIRVTELELNAVKLLALEIEN
jgi:hypothetical protein